MDIATIAAIGTLGVTASASLASLFRAVTGNARIGRGALLLLVMLVIFTVTREATLFWATTKYEEQNQQDKADVAKTCTQIESQKLRWTNGTRTECDYAAYVLKTTPVGRAFERWTARLTTIPSVADWLAANWLLALTSVGVLSFVFHLTYDGTQQWSQQMFDQIRMKRRVEKLLREETNKGKQ